VTKLQGKNNSEICDTETLTPMSPALNHHRTINKSGEPKGSSSIPSHSKKRKLSAPDPALLREFGAWYAAYPKHVGRDPAWKAWLKINPGRALLGTIMSATARYVDSKDGIEAKFILNPATWLNQKRWTDELSVGANGIGHAKPAEVKDLGDGFVEVDGRRMDKALYQRRYGTN
jgi:hypothetical protein